ncbi:MAG: hypothetical protein KatS3mg111_2377 [Pirellulaceae bacterium]|nr:MAG: hypothetical protein KatS3mg111_2377 [Pirellulaceae bacterium]
MSRADAETSRTPLDMQTTRRRFIASTAAAAAASSLPGMPGVQANPTDELGDPPLPPMGRAESVIFLWLGGGMAQIDTFDPKQRGDSKQRRPGTDYDVIDTVVPGVQVTEHLPEVARRMDRITAIRTVHHEMIDEHAAAVYWVHVGRPVSGTIQYPSLGAAVAHQRGARDGESPAYVLIGYPNVARSPGFLGPRYGYLYLTDLQSGPRGFSLPPYLSEERFRRRNDLLAMMQDRARQRLADPVLDEYIEAQAAAQKLSTPQFMSVFDLEREPDAVRAAYGGQFGQRCLLARRLTERGVRFVEVAHNLNFVNGTGWDTHKEGQQQQWVLIRELDQALAALIDDLEAKNRLDETLIVVATEFGRPAEFDGAGGRGHQSSTFTMVLAGGGLQHHGAIGHTDELSKQIVDRPVSIPDFHATIHHALGIDCRTELYDGDRPVPITDNGRPIAELFG